MKKLTATVFEGSMVLFTGLMFAGPIRAHA